MMYGRLKQDVKQGDADTGDLGYFFFYPKSVLLLDLHDQMFLKESVGVEHG